MGCFVKWQACTHTSQHEGLYGGTGLRIDGIWWMTQRHGEVALRTTRKLPDGLHEKKCVDIIKILIYLKHVSVVHRRAPVGAALPGVWRVAAKHGTARLQDTGNA